MARPVGKPHRCTIGRGDWHQWQYIFAIAGALTVNPDQTLRIVVGQDCTALEIYAYAKTAPTGQDLEGTIQYNRGLGWFPVGNLLIAAGANAGSVVFAAPFQLRENDQLRLDLTQVGSVVAGEDLTAHLRTIH